MENFDVWKLELHALRVLVTVYDTGSFTAAAERLELNQSTVSYTMERLRGVFADELFVRQGRGTAPSERCHILVSQARSLLRQYEDMTKPVAFEPMSFDGRFVLSCNPYEECVLLPALWSAMQEQAPLAQLSVIRTRSQGEQQLMEGLADVLVSPQALTNAGLQKRWLFGDRYVCFVGQPKAKDKLNWASYQNARHIRLRYDESWFPLYSDLLKQRGVRLKAALEVPGLSSLPPILQSLRQKSEGPEVVFTAPERLASNLGGLYEARLHKVSAPFDCRFDVSLYWPSRDQDSPRSRWLRSLIVQVAKGL